MILLPGKHYRIEVEWSGCSLEKNPCITGINKNRGLFDFDSDDLLDAIMTCGIPSFNLTKSMHHKRDREIEFKKNALEFMLNTITGDTSLYLNSNEFDKLDQSEKAVLSYYLGMFFTKLISKKLFDIQYLVHLKTAEAYTTIRYNTNSRPDFIGVSCVKTNPFSLFEAKGRQRNIKNTLAKARDQLDAVTYVAGSIPNPKVANMAFFKNDRLALSIIDPDGENTKEEILISEEGVVRTYYQPIYELIYEGDNFIETENKVSRIVDFNDNTQIRVELNRKVVNWLKEQEPFDKQLFSEKLYSIEYI